MNSGGDGVDTQRQLSELEGLGELEELEQWLPQEQAVAPPAQFSPPPLPDAYEQERFMRDLEERAHALKGFCVTLQTAADLARQITRDNGGANRLYIYASRWGVRIAERTPRLGLLEGRVEVENPDFVKRGG